MRKEALYYEKINDRTLKCFLCPRNCEIKEGRQGLCKTRRNISGKLYAENYGQVSSLSLDPIEKKPLRRFLPGTKILSAGTYGCNLKCSFCQNWRIAHAKPSCTYMEPEKLSEKALEMEASGNIGVAFTYNEPFVWFEYVLETAKINAKKGLKNILVTNGYVSEAPFKELLEYTDAVNIDLKAFDDNFYKHTCKAEGALEDVKKSIIAASGKCHTEVCCLIIPELNDSREDMEGMAQWLAGISKDIVLHISRYFPAYMMNRPPTPVQTIEDLYEIASKYLNHVFKGNI